MSRTFVAMAVGVFLAAAMPFSSAWADGDSRGETLFEICSQCHGSDGRGTTLAMAPSIAGLPQWYVEAQIGKFQKGLRGNHPDDPAGLRMAPMSLTLKTEADVQAVAAYVAAFPVERPEPQLTGGDAEMGKTYFAVCQACHGVDASGNQQLGAPPLRHASDWYLFNQLGKFRAGIRGANPADPVAMTMRPMSLTLPDEQAMKDVIAYVMSLPE